MQPSENRFVIKNERGEKMNGKFVLTIELGNDTMRTSSHVRTALLKTAEALKETPHKVGDSGSIRDSNGNTVGKWEFQDD